MTANRAWRAPRAPPRTGRRRNSAVTFLEDQGQRRAGVGRPPGEAEQLGRDLCLIEDRVTPVVEPDQLGEQLGAQAVGLAHDRVDA